MPYLIDGYNLLHALGILGKRMGPTGLEKARFRLLGLLRRSLGEQAAEVTVVFDAAGAPAGAEAETFFHGIRIRFANRHPQADDLIEELIRNFSAPKNLVVVSDDNRLAKAACRRGCRTLSCQDFLAHLDQQRRLQLERTPPVKEKQDSLTPEETQRWLAEFADLEDDPNWKRLFHVYDFEDS
jgi:uncharacterized protein